MTTSLSKAIYQYRAEWYGYLAASFEDDKAPQNYWPSLRTLEGWATPAANWAEASDALQLAIEFYDIGESDVIPAMMKAALSWITADAERRAAE